MAIVFRFVGHHNDYPSAYGYSEAFEQIVRNWRPELVDSTPTRRVDPGFKWR